MFLAQKNVISVYISQVDTALTLYWYFNACFRRIWKSCPYWQKKAFTWTTKTLRWTVQEEFLQSIRQWHDIRTSEAARYQKPQVFLHCSYSTYVSLQVERLSIKRDNSYRNKLRHYTLSILHKETVFITIEIKAISKYRMKKRSISKICHFFVCVCVCKRNLLLRICITSLIWLHCGTISPFLTAVNRRLTLKTYLPPVS